MHSLSFPLSPLPPKCPPPPSPSKKPHLLKRSELHQTFADSCCDWQQAYTQAKDCLVCLASTQTKLSSSPIPDPQQAFKNNNTKPFNKRKQLLTTPPPPPPPSFVFSFWLLKGWDLHSSILQQQIIQCISNDKSNAKRKKNRKNTHKTIQPSNQMTST